MFRFVLTLAKIHLSSISNKDAATKRAIYCFLRDRGGIYLKFLQAISLTQNFMVGWSGPKEYEIFNHSPLEDIDVFCYVNRSYFSRIDPEPVAAGSFAVIFQGWLLDGKHVAIKVLRPSIVKSLRKDLKKLSRVVRVISKFLPETVIDYRAAFAEFAENSLSEVNYVREIENIKYFKKIYKTHPYIVIPEVYPEFSNCRVIVEEFISGPTLADVMSNVECGRNIVDYNQPGSNIWTQLTMIGGEALRTAMTEDFVFGDPHPGNIVLLPNNKVAFIDFGLVAARPTSQEAFYLWTKSYNDILQGNGEIGELLRTTIMCFCPDMINAFDASDTGFMEGVVEAITKKGDRTTSLSNDVAALVNDGHLAKVFVKFIDKNNSLGIKIDAHNFALLKSMQAYLSTITTLDNKYGNSSYAGVMSGAMKYALDYCEKVKVARDYDTSTRYTMSDCYELILDSLSSLAENDEFLFNYIYERISV